MPADPAHVAIIMDGNRRWAARRGQPHFAGHLAGAQNVPRIINAAIRAGVEVLTLFAFSGENWGRPIAEVDYLMDLFLDTVKNQLHLLQERNVRLRVVGDLTMLSQELQAHITQAHAETQANTGLQLVACVNYTGRWDITRAARQLVAKAASGKLTAADVDEGLLAQHLSTHELPAPDLLIRTSGEQRLSNFLLWQMAYTELYFCPLYWPDFHEAEFEQALAAYRKRDRRFGVAQAEHMPVMEEGEGEES